ncbi:SseB family protein [Actinomadura miaoliensis]|uniref:SseB family protein n=1 Tax=Actinomadura miaoliensis TaxID=430685 RepID=A0ABP7VSU3_9ACTN
MDWNDFAKRLTIELLRLPVRAFLIVEAPGGLPYTQAMRTEESLQAEAVSSAFLPRPLSPGQERRLAALGWQRPDEHGRGGGDGADGEERRNWWHRFDESDGSSRDDKRFAEDCAILAGMMVGAFREVHGLSSPRGLVYQAARTGPDGGVLTLPELGIPPAPVEGGEVAAPVDVEPSPAGGGASADVDKALADARERGDQDAYLRLLSGATLYLPDPGSSEAPGGGDGRHYATARFGEGTFVLAFTSPEAMDTSLRGQAVHHRTSSLAELARHWPHPDWQLAVNPGLPSAAYLDAPALLPQRPGDAEQGAGQGAGQGNAPTARKAAVQSAANGGEAARTPKHEKATDTTVMQKVVRPDHVAHYVEGGYDLVAGYVHRLQDVRELNTPSRLVHGLGLAWDGSPFSAGDEEIHVIRWQAVRPALYRRPLGGIDEWSMSIIPGGWVIEKAPFHGSGYASGDGPAIPEFKVDSLRLPHGAEIWRLGRSGGETLVAAYDADQRRWTRRDDDDAAPGRYPRERARGRE